MYCHPHPGYDYWGRQKWSEDLTEELKGCGEDVIIMDVTSMPKCLVQGRYAEKALNNICANDMAIHVGKIGYTQWLNERGGIEADLTVTCLVENKFFILEDPEPLLFGHEVAYRDSKIAGHLQTGAYGFTLGGAVGMGFVENEAGTTRDFINSGCYEIDIAGERYSAKASLRPMYDPKGINIHSYSCKEFANVQAIAVPRPGCHYRRRDCWAQCRLPSNQTWPEGCCAARA